MWTKTFWKRAAERAVRTAAQAAVAVLVAGVVTGQTGNTDVSLWLIDWPSVAGIAGGAAVVSLLTSVAASHATDDHTDPSFVK